MVGKKALWPLRERCFHGNGILCLPMWVRFHQKWQEPFNVRLTTKQQKQHQLSLVYMSFPGLFCDVL